MKIESNNYDYTDDDESHSSCSSDDEIDTKIKNKLGEIKNKDDDEFEQEMLQDLANLLGKFPEQPKENNHDANLNESEIFKKKSKDEKDDLEFYDSDLDDDNQKWIDEQRKEYLRSSAINKPLPKSDAVLNCPCCFVLLTLDCQRHEVYLTQYRAMFVSNCTTEETKVEYKFKANKKSKKPVVEYYNQVVCSSCGTQIALYDNEQVYHFFNVLSSHP